VTAEGGEKQKKILDCTGHALVMGGPGSGKTTLALAKAYRATPDLRPGQAVLFLSFSRAAVARLDEAAAGQFPTMDRRSIRLQTFHSFCWELLKAHGYLLGAPRRLAVLTPHEEASRSGGASTKRERKEAFAKWDKERTRLFHDEGLVAFDLFAPMVTDLLSRSRRIRDLTAARFPLIIVDEAQDTNDAQWAVARQLAQESAMLCLADPDQMIFDWLPGVGPERIGEIETDLSPMIVDLGGVNHRSGDSDILRFGDDVLAGRSGRGPYDGVQQVRVGYKAAQRDKWIRQSVGIIAGEVKKKTGEPPESIALLARTTNGTSLISGALSGAAKPIAHKCLDDETSALLGGRLVAYLLEPRSAADHAEGVAQVLELLSAIESAAGTKGGRTNASKWRGWAQQVRGGKVKPSTAGLFKEVVALVENAEAHRFSGDPRVDWSTIRGWLRGSSADKLSRVDAIADNLLRLNRGKLISSSLSTRWQETGTYQGARAVYDSALAQDQLLAGLDEAVGVQVMTIHKAKGKQFDAVVIYRDKWAAPLVTKRDKAPYKEPRRIARVAITRARHRVLVLAQAGVPCPITGGFKL